MRVFALQRFVNMAGLIREICQHEKPLANEITEPPAFTVSNQELRGKGSVENAECGVWKMRSVENAECGKCGVWKMRSVENAGCGKCGVWKMRGVENAECGKCGVWKMRGVENAECGKCGVWKMSRKFQFSISI